MLTCEPTKLSILRSYLPQLTREEIWESFLTHPINYWLVLEELDSRYNLPHLVARANIHELVNLPLVPIEHRPALLSFCRKVSSLIKTLTLIGQVADLKSTITLTQLIGKLPRHKQKQSGVIEYDISQRYLTRTAYMSDFKGFLDLIAGIEVLSFQPEVSFRTREKRPGSSSAKAVKPLPPRTQQTIFTTSTPDKSGSAPSVVSTCFACGGPSCSNIFSCEEFRSMSPKDRVRRAKEKKCCLNCDHVIDVCLSNRSYFIDGCSVRLRHHTLLHGADLFSRQRRCRLSHPRRLRHRNWYDGHEQTDELRNFPWIRPAPPIEDRRVRVIRA